MIGMRERALISLRTCTVAVIMRFPLKALLGKNTETISSGMRMEFTLQSICQGNWTCLLTHKETNLTSYSHINISTREMRTWKWTLQMSSTSLLQANCAIMGSVLHSRPHLRTLKDAKCPHM